VKEEEYLGGYSEGKKQPLAEYVYRKQRELDSKRARGRGGQRLGGRGRK